MKEPQNIFEQILYGQLTTNDNIVTLSQNLADIHERLENLMAMVKTIHPEEAKPIAPGVERDEELQ